MRQIKLFYDSGKKKEPSLEQAVNEFLKTHVVEKVQFFPAVLSFGSEYYPTVFIEYLTEKQETDGVK